MRVINFFRTSSKCPVEDFLDKLSAKETQKITWVMSLVEELEIVPIQYFKKLSNTEEIWEIRIGIGSNIYRILGFFENTKHFIATNAFRKKTQTTPKKEVLLTQKRRKEYLKLRDVK